MEINEIELRAKCMNWLARGEAGTSSKTMAFCACDIEYEDQCHPLDPADLNRCIKVVESIPEIRKAFEKIAKLSDDWRRVIDHWDELAGLFIEEVGYDWSKCRSAPITYKRMKELKL
jgi:hypothetical protein